MIVFDLECREGGHRFEGWFGSSADYDDQQARGLLDAFAPAGHEPSPMDALSVVLRGQYFKRDIQPMEISRRRNETVL